jgi:hypothetical protein
MFINPETQAIDESQKRAFEVIVSMFVITFHKEAERNEGEHMLEHKTPGIDPNITNFFEN